MKRRLMKITWVVAVLAGCGRDSPLTIAATFPAAIASVANIDVFVVAGGLHCPATPPFSGSADIVFNQLVPFSAGAALDNVPTGNGLTIVAEAYDASGTALAGSCVEGVSIRAGATTRVTLAFTASR